MNQWTLAGLLMMFGLAGCTEGPASSESDPEPAGPAAPEVDQAAVYLKDVPPSPDPWRASAEGDLALLKISVTERGFDPNLADPLFKTTPLGHAAWWGQSEAVAFLLANQADPDLAYGDPWTTPLHMACLWGHDEVAAALLRAGVDPTVREESGGLPMDYLRISEEDTMELAKAFQAPFSFEAIQAGREEIRKLLP